MPILLWENEIRLERKDLERRVAIVHQTAGELIVPPARTPGLHASGLLRYVAQTSGITKYKEQLDEEELPLRMALGLAWEEFAVSLHSDIVWQPGETFTPIIMTCDGLGELMDNEPMIEELKLTWKHRKLGADLLRESWLWVQQAAIYCLGYGADVVRWHVCWVNGGGYKGIGGADPAYVQYVARFSGKELAETARMIELNRSAAIANGYAE